MEKSETYRLKRLWLLMPGAAALVLTWVASANSPLTEAWFSRGVYPWLSSALAPEAGGGGARGV